MNTTREPSRRTFLRASAGALAGAGLMAASAPSGARANEETVATGGRRGRRGVRLSVFDRPVFLQGPAG